MRVDQRLHSANILNAAYVTRRVARYAVATSPCVSVSMTVCKAVHEAVMWSDNS